MSWFEVMWHSQVVQGTIRRLSWRHAGQSTVEYALVGALVVIGAAAALTVLGDQVSAVFGSISNALRGAAH
jgi:Flp pilus assembly pilin Flp